MVSLKQGRSWMLKVELILVVIITDICSLDFSTFLIGINKGLTGVIRVLLLLNNSYYVFLVPHQLLSTTSMQVSEISYHIPCTPPNSA